MCQVNERVDTPGQCERRQRLRGLPGRDDRSRDKEAHGDGDVKSGARHIFVSECQSHVDAGGQNQKQRRELSQPELEYESVRCSHVQTRNAPGEPSERESQTGRRDECGAEGLGHGWVV